MCIRTRFFSKSTTRHIHTTGIPFKQLTELASISGRWGEMLSANATSNSTNKKQDNTLSLSGTLQPSWIPATIYTCLEWIRIVTIRLLSRYRNTPPPAIHSHTTRKWDVTATSWMRQDTGVCIVHWFSGWHISSEFISMVTFGFSGFFFSFPRRTHWISFNSSTDQFVWLWLTSSLSDHSLLT